MTRGELPALELRLHAVREREEPQCVRDGRPALAHTLGDLLLREAVDLDSWR